MFIVNQCFTNQPAKYIQSQVMYYSNLKKKLQLKLQATKGYDQISMNHTRILTGSFTRAIAIFASLVKLSTNLPFKLTKKRKKESTNIIYIRRKYLTP